MKWKDKLIKNLIESLQKVDESDEYLKDIINYEVNIHLAIFSEPFLSYLLSGKKTLESRLSINRTSPFGKVYANDIVLIKKTGGEIYGLFRVDNVKFFSNINSEIIRKIDEEHGSKILWNLDPQFLISKSDAKFLTLITIGMLIKIKPFETEKSDRTAWVTIRKGFVNTLFQNNEK
jgi:hypothetical protein